MRLSTVQIIRFRGLRRCSLNLAPTTVIIGENNCGKTSILDAIGLVMSEAWASTDPPVGSLDFHRQPGDEQPSPVRIDLTFADAPDRPWPQSTLDRLGSAVWTDRDGLRHVRLRGEAHPPGSDGRARTELRAVGADGEPLDTDGSALQSTLRSLMPVLRLHAGRSLALRHFDQITDGAAGANPTAIGDRLAELYDTLVSPTDGWPDLATKLRELGSVLALDATEIAAVGGSSDRLVEILTNRVGRMALSGGAELPLGRQGGGAQTLVVMLLLGALLAAGAQGLDPMAEPLVILEDPEAHLHPRTLAYLARAIKALRAQRLVVTHSGDLLTALPLESLRRLHRRGEDVRVHQLAQSTLTAEEWRKVNYHIRARRRTVLFARCWLLVEGESEFWLLPALAQKLGFELVLEGISCVEFAQCGLRPLIRTADDLGIQWHVLADGDEAGAHYARAAGEWVGQVDPAQRITALGDRDIEHCLWHHGYAQVYRDAAGLAGRKPRHGERPGPVISNAIRNTSKPTLAQRITEAVLADGSPGTPAAIARAIHAVVELARAQSPRRTPGRRSRGGD